MTILERFYKEYKGYEEKIKRINEFEKDKYINENYDDILFKIQGKLYEQLNDYDVCMGNIKHDFFLDDEPTLNLDLEKFNKRWDIESMNKFEVKETNKLISIKLKSIYEPREYHVNPSIASFLFYNSVYNLRVLMYLEQKYNIDLSVLRNKVDDEYKFSEFISFIGLDTDITEVKFFKNGNVIINIRKDEKID